MITASQMRAARALLGIDPKKGNSPTRVTQVGGTWTRVGPFAGGLENGVRAATPNL